MVFAGTMITNGYATALVTRTGMETEIGKIQQAVIQSQVVRMTRKIQRENN